MVTVTSFCAALFILARAGGFSCWKEIGIKRIVIVLLFVLPISVSAGIIGYAQYLFIGIDNAPTWSQQAKRLQQYIVFTSHNSQKTGEKFAARLFNKCPDLESFLILSEEDKDIYYFIVGEYGRFAIYDLLGSSIEDKKSLSNVLEFMNTVRQSVHGTFNYNFDLAFNMETRISHIPEYDYSEKKAEYQEKKKYIILFYRGENEALSLNSGLILKNNLMVNYLPDDNIPENADDIDYAIVISTYLHGGAVYSGGIGSYDRTTYISIYNYLSGEVEGNIGTISTGVPINIQRTAGDKRDEISALPADVIEKQIAEFFGKQP
jgi:hypothetical protein